MSQKNSNSEWKCLPHANGFFCENVNTPAILKDELPRLISQVVSQANSPSQTRYGRGRTFVFPCEDKVARLRIYRRGGLVRYFSSFTFFGSAKNSRVCRELKVLSFLQDNDVSVCRPLGGYVDSFCAGLFYRCVIATEEVENAKNVLVSWNDDDNSDEIARMSRAIALQVVQLLELGVQHMDLYPGNVLLDELGKLILIDFDRAAICQKGIDLQVVSYYRSRWARGCKKHLDSNKAQVAIENFEQVLTAAMGKLGLVC